MGRLLHKGVFIWINTVSLDFIHIHVAFKTYWIFVLPWRRLGFCHILAVCVHWATSVMTSANSSNAEVFIGHLDKKTREIPRYNSGCSNVFEYPGLCRATLIFSNSSRNIQLFLGFAQAIVNPMNGQILFWPLQNVYTVNPLYDIRYNSLIRYMSIRSAQKSANRVLFHGQSRVIQ